MFNTIFDLIKSKRVKSISYILPNGKEKYTVTNEGNTKTIVRETRILQLRKDIFLNDNNKESELVDDSIINDLCQSIKNNITSIQYFDPYSDEFKINEIYEERDFEIDRKITITSTPDGTKINGIIIDLDNNDGFSYTYRNGIVWDAYNCREFIALYKKYNELNIPIEEQDYHDYEDKLSLEIYTLIRETLTQSNGIVEKNIRGLYVIIDNIAYYFTSSEYINLINNNDKSKSLKCLEIINSKGFVQLNQHLLNDTTYYNTLNFIATNADLENRKSINIYNEYDLGMDYDTFTSKLFDDDNQALKILSNNLKDNQKVLQKK